MRKGLCPRMQQHAPRPSPRNRKPTVQQPTQYQINGPPPSHQLGSFSIAKRMTIECGFCVAEHAAGQHGVLLCVHMTRPAILLARSAAGALHATAHATAFATTHAAAHAAAHAITHCTLAPPLLQTLRHPRKVQHGKTRAVRTDHDRMGITGNFMQYNTGPPMQYNAIRVLYLRRAACPHSHWCWYPR